MHPAGPSPLPLPALALAVLLASCGGDTAGRWVSALTQGQSDSPTPPGNTATFPKQTLVGNGPQAAYAGGATFSTERRNYQLVAFGMLHEVFTGRPDNRVASGVHDKAVGAYRAHP